MPPELHCYSLYSLPAHADLVERLLPSHWGQVVLCIKPFRNVAASQCWSTTWFEDQGIVSASFELPFPCTASWSEVAWFDAKSFVPFGARSTRQYLG
jgi:hypothetical protein